MVVFPGMGYPDMEDKTFHEQHITSEKTPQGDPKHTGGYLIEKGAAVNDWRHNERVSVGKESTAIMLAYLYHPKALH